MTPEEVAAAFRVHVKTVARWAAGGRFPESFRTLGGHRRWRRSDITAFLNSQAAQR
jgi:excisionase family DNA binding protein